ncbi:MAG TPA: group 1 truncated hemoglobin [Myxococcota bacterium]|nr:group 1 truncated hemoglobin [Myxococcota bacterium]
MRTRSAIACVALACVACVALACARPPWNHATLYDDLGGEKGVARIVSAFLVRLAKDPISSPFFAKTDMKRFERLLNEQLCQVSDGPCRYSGDSMSDAHRGLGIGDTAFTALVQDLEMAMDDVRVPFQIQNRLLARLAPMHDEIVEGDPCSPFAWSAEKKARCAKLEAMRKASAP